MTVATAKKTRSVRTAMRDARDAINRGVTTKPRTVREAAREASRSRKPVTTEVQSHWTMTVRDRNGRIKWKTHWHRNLATTTAAGYTNELDWQAKLMGGGLAPVATFTGNATATSATSLTNTGASFPTAGQGLAGQIVVCGPRATSSSGDAISWGIIVSNSGTVLTIDQWYNGGTWAAGTTPNATGAYVVLPGQAAAMYMAVTANATAPSTADTTLTAEATTNGFARALATWAHTAAAVTYTMAKTFTATGSLTPSKYALFGAVNTTAGGVMPFESLIASAPVLLSGDSVAITATVTIG